VEKSAVPAGYAERNDGNGSDKQFFHDTPRAMR
jgi:hypothetical protein